MLALSLLFAALFGIPPWFLGVCAGVCVAAAFVVKPEHIRYVVATLAAIIFIMLIG